MSDQKTPSGAQKRKARKARELAERLALGESDPGVSAYAALGAAPIEDASTAMEWVRKVQLVALEQLLRDPALSPREKFRAVKEMSEAIGKTQNRAQLEADVKRLKAALDVRAAASGAVKMEKASDVIRPPTARGQRGHRGPRPLSGPGPDSAKGQDA